jgi:DNA-binding CsgD family transcriptional regulator
MKVSPGQKDLLEEIERLERRLAEAGEQKAALLEGLGKTVLNALSIHVALLDADGTIIATNLEWNEYGRKNTSGSARDTIGMNYLAVCDAAEGEYSEEAGEVARGIRSVLSGEEQEYSIEYPCHSPTEKRWYFMRAVRLDGPGPLRVVVSHEDITALKRAEERLGERERELEGKTRDLGEINTALKVLLERREADRKEFEERVLGNVKQRVLPYLERLKGMRLQTEAAECVRVVESNLQEIVSPFLDRLTSSYYGLTPQEIQVAGLVKDGKMTKEIARFLNISASAVDFHRKNIRRKLGLKSKKANLRSTLLSLSES